VQRLLHGYPSDRVSPNLDTEVADFEGDPPNSTHSGWIWRLSGALRCDQAKASRIAVMWSTRREMWPS
jgi:hypothetical protein